MARKFDTFGDLLRGALGPTLTAADDSLDLYAEDVVFEFTCEGRAVSTGVAYDQTYISVVTLRNGRIARYKDYWNPLVTLAALGGTGAAASDCSTLVPCSALTPHDPRQSARDST